MKQNSSILFHSMRIALNFRLFGQLLPIFFWATCFSCHIRAAQPPEYLASFDPAKGFKPAQRDLTEVFLQLAGSLENYGSPEPYLRHMAKEHTRIESIYAEETGKKARSFQPAYLSDAYIDRLAANWKLLAPKLGLETYAKEFGHSLREAIRGTRGMGTILVDIFNEHQRAVLDEMAGKGKGGADFETLRVKLIHSLELDKATVDEGKYEVARRDAVRSAIIIHGMTMKLFAEIDRQLEADKADQVKAVLTSLIVDTGMMAQSELEVGIAEWAARKPTSESR